MNGFSDLDIVNYRYLVYSNLIQGMYQLIEGAETLGLGVSEDVMVILDRYILAFKKIFRKMW